MAILEGLKFRWWVSLKIQLPTPQRPPTGSVVPGRLFPFRSTLVLAGNIFHER